MSEFRASLNALRSFMVAGCLAVLVGCIPEPITPPANAPADLVAVGGNAQVALTWTATGDTKGYNVKRSTTNGGNYVLVAAVSSASYTDVSVTNNTTYYYVVSAFNNGGESPNSAQVLAIPAVPSIPLAPLDLAAAVGDRQVTLNWAVSIGATSYRVKRSTTSGGPYTQVAAPTVTTFTDTLLTNGTTYYYVVSAVNTLGESPNSPQVFAVPSPPPPATFGTWINVTPSSVNLTTSPSGSSCPNSGASTVQKDPANPGHLYTLFHCQGIWKSMDYGATWTGPLNSGAGNAVSRDCAGGISISPSSTAAVPTIYQSCIYGDGVGFWRSVNGGATFTRYNVAPGGARQDYYEPAIDPNDLNHLLMAGHEFDSLVESTNGGLTWANVPIDSGMETGTFLKSGYIAFINTGTASTTRTTWLWIGQELGGFTGTWRTANSGTSWVRVDKNEHPVGSSQVYQPGTSGVLFMAGMSSDLGRGVLRSNDYGQTWTHVGLNNDQNVVIGSSKNLYGMYGVPLGPTASYDPAFQVASQPGTGTWVLAPPSPGLTQGPGQLGLVNDGTHNILLGAMWNKGVWRYVEP